MLSRVFQTPKKQVLSLLKNQMRGSSAFAASDIFEDMSPSKKPSKISLTFEQDCLKPGQAVVFSTSLRNPDETRKVKNTLKKMGVNYRVIDVEAHP